MLQNSKGIVLRAMPYSESSLIVRIYTREFGLLSFIVKGARSSRSGAKATLLHPPNMLDLVIYYREGRNLQNLKELSLRHAGTGVDFHPGRSATALFIVELLNRVLLDQDTNAALYDYLEQSLLSLGQTSKGIGCFPHLFMCGLSRHLGFAPEVIRFKPEYCFDLVAGRFEVQEQCGLYRLEKPESLAMSKILKSDFTDLPELRLSSEVRKSLMNGLLDFYRLQIEHFGKMNAPAILESVLRAGVHKAKAPPH